MVLLPVAACAVRSCGALPAKRRSWRRRWRRRGGRKRCGARAHARHGRKPAAGLHSGAHDLRVHQHVSARVETAAARVAAGRGGQRQRKPHPRCIMQHGHARGPGRAAGGAAGGAGRVRGGGGAGRCGRADCHQRHQRCAGLGGGLRRQLGAFGAGRTTQRPVAWPGSVLPPLAGTPGCLHWLACAWLQESCGHVCCKGAGALCWATRPRVRHTQHVTHCVARATCWLHAGGRDAVLGHPATLALAGLVSGAISARKNWRST